MARLRLAVVYIGDANYHRLTLHSMASVARSHKVPLDLHLMQSHYDAAIDPAFSAFLAARGHRLFARRVAFAGPEIGSRAAARTYTYISDAMFLKAAAIEALASEYDYVLYLDSDVLAFDDIKLEALAGFPEVAAACVDQTVAGEMETTGTSGNYVFNSGLLLVNTSEWLRRGIRRRFVEKLHEHQVACPYCADCEPNDQCSLNMALTGQWLVLDPTLNVQKVAMHTRAWDEARVRHYAGPNKFMPLRLHRCDAREYALLSAISRDAGLPHPGRFHDGGLSYRLNGLRRRRDVELAETTMARIASA